MKKNLLGLAAFVLAIAFTSFTVFEKTSTDNGKFATRYAVYKIMPTGIDPQTIPGNYTVQAPTPSDCPEEARLCWIQFQDTNNNGVLDPSELAAYFLTHDTNGDKSLDDEAEEAGVLEKKQ